MHVDLVEALRCPNGHADGWLVAAADAMVDRRIVRGTIGCPQCGAEWPVVDGALHLTRRAAPTAAQRAVGASSGTDNAEPASLPAPEPADTLRTAALLALTDARGAVLLAGEYARQADAVQRETGVLILTLNPAPGVATAHARLFADSPLPVGVGTFRGVCLDERHSTAPWLASATRVVEQGGRVIASHHAPLPADLRELARDDREWVAEVRVAASGLVPLRRGGDPMA
jgi:uncharacterized protein YbaR (Trm112 family)